MRFVIILFLLFRGSQFILAGQAGLQETESELAFYCDIMTNASEGRHRLRATEKFNTLFFEALSQKGSFSYPFDSLKWVSRKTAEDRSFRLITWEARISDYDTRYFGVIQKADGSIIRLNDRFKQAESFADDEFDADNWLGSLCYNMMEIKTSDKEKYWLIFGVNRLSREESVKIVDVMFFSSEGVPYFGQPVFVRMSPDGKEEDTFHRLVFKYSADAIMTINYNPGMEMIMADHLIPRMSRINNKIETMVPDGSYIGYERKDGRWVYVDKIATEVMDSAPRPKPVLDQRKGKKIFGN